MKLFETLEKQLKKENNFVTDNGELKKWIVINKAQNFDVTLIELLLENKVLKDKFFISVKGASTSSAQALVFNQNLFVQFLEQKNRLESAKTLLNKQGIIFVHCDNNEQAYLKVLLDDVFGIENFIDTITVVNNPRGRDYGGVANMHEFIHIYSKSEFNYEMYPMVDPDKKFPFEDNIGPYETRELRNRNTAFNDKNRPNLCYPFYVNPVKEIDNGFLELSLEKKGGFIEVWPAKSQGIQTVWRWGKPKAEGSLNIDVVGKASNQRFLPNR